MELLERVGVFWYCGMVWIIEVRLGMLIWVDCNTESSACVLTMIRMGEIIHRVLSLISIRAIILCTGREEWVAKRGMQLLEETLLTVGWPANRSSEGKSGI